MCVCSGLYTNTAVIKRQAALHCTLCVSCARCLVSFWKGQPLSILIIHWKSFWVTACQCKLCSALFSIDVVMSWNYLSLSSTLSNYSPCYWLYVRLTLKQELSPNLIWTHLIAKLQLFFFYNWLIYPVSGGSLSHSALLIVSPLKPFIELCFVLHVLCKAFYRKL